MVGMARVNIYIDPAIPTVWALTLASPRQSQRENNADNNTDDR